MFCCTLLYVHSSIAIILMGKRELIALLNLSSWCLVMVERLFLAVPRGCLQFVIVVFPDHTHLLFLLSKITIRNFCALTQKNFHVSIKKLRICANNPALEDFVIQNRHKEFLRTYAKNFHVSIKNLRICRNSFRSIAICIILFKDMKIFRANNPKLKDFTIRIFCVCTRKIPCLYFHLAHISAHKVQQQ